MAHYAASQQMVHWRGSAAGHVVQPEAGYDSTVPAAWWIPAYAGMTGSRGECGKDAQHEDAANAPVATPK